MVVVRFLMALMSEVTSGLTGTATQERTGSLRASGFETLSEDLVALFSGSRWSGDDHAVCAEYGN